jgi:hypothetical protein
LPGDIPRGDESAGVTRPLPVTFSITTPFLLSDESCLMGGACDGCGLAGSFFSEVSSLIDLVLSATLTTLSEEVLLSGGVLILSVFSPKVPLGLSALSNVAVFCRSIFSITLDLSRVCLEDFSSVFSMVFLIDFSVGLSEETLGLSLLTFSSLPPLIGVVSLLEESLSSRLNY